MKWKGKNLDTYPKIINYALKATPKDRKEFVEAYAKTGPHALTNVGYFSGYYDGKTMLKIQRIFKTAHPIFGRRIVSAEEAFGKGRQLGKEKRRAR